MAPFIASAARNYQELLHDTVQLPALIAIVQAGHHPLLFSMDYSFENTLPTWPTPFNPMPASSLIFWVPWVYSWPGNHLMAAAAYLDLFACKCIESCYQEGYGALLLRTAHHFRCNLACCIGGSAS